MPVGRPVVGSASGPRRGHTPSPGRSDQVGSAHREVDGVQGVAGDPELPGRGHCVLAAESLGVVGGPPMAGGGCWGRRRRGQPGRAALGSGDAPGVQVGDRGGVGELIRRRSGW